VYAFLRAFWNLAAVGGAIAVGFTTQNAGFIAITLIGGFIVPRMLGLAGPVGPFARYRRAVRGGPGWGGPWRGSCGGPWAASGGWEDWHRRAHEAQSTSPPPPSV